MDKVKKIIYIISGSLSIMLMVFLLMHKVGLCASSEPTINGFYPLDFPLPINGEYFGSSFVVTPDVIEEILSVSQNSSNDAVVMREESIDGNYIQVEVYEIGSYGFEKQSGSTVFDSSFRWRVIRSSFIQYSFTTGQASLISVAYSNGQPMNGFSLLPYYGFSQLPNGEYYLPYNTYISSYPLWVSDGILTYNGVTYFLNWSVPGSGGNDFGDFDFPEYESLPNDITDNQNPDYNLYSWLNGQNKANYDYTKSIFDLLKGFFSWFTAPLDEDVITNSWNDTDLGGVVNYVSGLGNTLKSLLGNGAQAPETLSFNCSITLLNHTFPYTVDFSWYQQIKTQFLTVFLTFFYVGAFLYFIKSIPSFINGVSGTMNNFTQAGGGSDD